MTASDAAAEVRILEFRAKLWGPDAVRLGLPALFPSPPPWTLCGGVAVEVAFDVHPDPAQSGAYWITEDGGNEIALGALEDALPALEWRVNSAAVAALGARYLLLHAGVVACDGQGIILPAVPNSRKTTLTAAAVATGFQYLSDEVAALPLGTCDLVPFAKSLFVKQGSRSLLGAWYPELADAPPRRRVGGEPVWYLPPPAGAWPVAPVPLRHIVFPRYVPGAQAELAPISRADALPLLLQQSFNVRSLGALGIGAVVALLRGATCHTLTVDHLAPAVALLQQLLEA